MGAKCKAMEFLSRASRQQLRAAHHFLQETQPNSRYLRGMEFLISHDRKNTAQVMCLLRSDDILERRYAAVASARMSMGNRTLLSYASTISDASPFFNRRLFFFFGLLGGFLGRCLLDRLVVVLGLGRRRPVFVSGHLFRGLGRLSTV